MTLNLSNTRFLYCILSSLSHWRKMKVPKSKKAIHVCREAPSFCRIWFVCRGELVYTRFDGVNEDKDSPSFLPSPSTEGKNDRARIDKSEFEHKFLSDNRVTPHGSATPCSIQEESIECDGFSRADSCFSSSSSEIIEDSALISFPKMNRIREQAGRESHQSLVASGVTASASPRQEEGDMNNGLHAQIDHYLIEAETAQKALLVESIRQKKAEKELNDTIRKVKDSETMYDRELHHRKELEKSLQECREGAEKVKRRLDEVTNKLRTSQEQKRSFESRIADSDGSIEESKQKLFSAVEMLQRFKKERDELQVARDNALNLAEELIERHSDEPSSSSITQFFSEFSFSEIETATCRFDSSLKIDEGSYGCIYKGSLQHTRVAIKVLNPNNWLGPSEFQQEVRILSQLRHPNIVTLIGACPEIWGLVYEYIPNGSLEDRLNCKDNTPPLPWQTRIHIAAELCSALIFSHSCCPGGVIHGNVKPSNVFLDANFVSKLTDFGICRLLPSDESSYMDPEFLISGDLTTKSDVYSFGIILLRLLTGLPPLEIAKKAQCAIDEGNLKNILDTTAGDWPFVQAKQLAHLALTCADTSRKCRPDLCSEVWKVLEPMRVSSGSSFSRKLGSDEHSHVPSYFVCPIFQEVMQDPVVSADGFTYEAEAIKGWFESGHDTSPMTNLKLPNCDVVANHSLRSAIKEWLQKA